MDHSTSASARVSQIRPGLCLGNLTSLRTLFQLGVTHVLSVMKDAPQVCDMHMGTGCKQMSIPVDDEEGEDLLQFFEPGIAFIRTALAAGGKVLVHCIAGVSRSPTVVAAYLMAIEGLDTQTAVASIQALRRMVMPNPGFLLQLQVWEEMRCTIDPSHPFLKQRALATLSEQCLAGEAVPKQALAIPSEHAVQQETLYRCRKCRSLIATSANTASSYTVQQHTVGLPQFTGKRTNKEKGAGSTDQTQLFVEPMQWMEEVVEGQLKGKLYCPGCRARLGSFNWAGMQNSKAAWITPAFELQLSRLDAMPSQPTTRIHRPSLS